MEFVGRQKEFDVLNKLLDTPHAELAVLYGRRRIGKTRLVSLFLEQQRNVDSFYWMATTHNEVTQLRDFSQALWQLDPRFTDLPAADFSFTSWDEALNHLADIVELDSEPYVIVLDEFTYLLRNEPAISSVIQKLWDHRFSQIPQLKLILTGSLIGMMARQVFSYQAPLYGRATTLLHLKALPYETLIELFPKRSAAERVAIYGVAGGVPAYLELFTRESTFAKALKEHCLALGSIMLSDPAVIIYEQLTEPQSYESILSAIASGAHGWRDIAKMAGIKETNLSHYLNVLQELELVEKRLPILSKPSSRKGRYYICDPFLRFYYRFIVPQLGPIERGYQEAVVEKIWAELRSFLGEHVFEGLCQEWVWRAAMNGTVDFVPEKVGSYWRRVKGEGVQLDVVAATPREKRLLIGEAKWGRSQVGKGILLDLIERSQRMPQVADGWQVSYVLFSRTGFTSAAQTEAKERGVTLVTLDELERELG